MNSILINRTVVKVRCDSKSSSSQSNPTVKNISNIRKEFEKTRSNTLKDNVNKLIAIARSDIKEYSDLFKELDDVHKESINNFINQVKNYVNDNKSSKKTSGVKDSSDSTEESQDENIFLN